MNRQMVEKFNINIQLFAKGDTLTDRADIAKAMYVGTKEVFKKTLKKNRSEEWKNYCSMKTSDKMEETYDTIGNLKPATEKVEGAPVVYGDIVEGTTTTITNKTYANGLAVTMEAQEDEQYGMIPVAKTEELARTMLQLRERNVAAAWDGTNVNVGADGVAHAHAAHPLLNSVETNNNLVAAVFDLTSYKAAANLFNGWKNHAGEKFDTLPTMLLAHRDRQTEVLAMLESTLVAFENSNTKNTIPKLKPVFSRYIAALPVYLIDEMIDSVIFQRRKALTTEYDYDKRDTFNWYFNVHERYRVGVINPGYGFVRINGV